MQERSATKRPYDSRGARDDPYYESKRPAMSDRYISLLRLDWSPSSQDKIFHEVPDNCPHKFTPESRWPEVV